MNNDDNLTQAPANGNAHEIDNRGIVSALKDLFRNRQKQYTYYPEEIAAMNMDAVGLLSMVAFVLTFVFMGLASVIIPEWRILPVHIWMALALTGFAAFARCCPLKWRKNNLFVTCFTMLFLITMLGLIVVVDLYAAGGGSAIFTPVIYVAASTLLILPVFCSMPAILLAEAVFIVGVLQLKPPSVAATDILASLAGLALSAVVGFTIASVNIRESARLHHYRIASRIDGLTGVLNKAAVENAISEYLLERDEEEPCMMMELDIDNFKKINDSLGHDEGDLILKHVGDTLLKCFRASDIIGRNGGDEFLILLKDVQEDEISEAKFREIQERLAKSSGASARIRLCCSIGAVWIQRGKIDYPQLFHAVDEALYSAKSSGKDRTEIRRIM